MDKIMTKNDISTALPAKKGVRRDIRAFRALRGIWKGKKIGNVITWQRRIRKEWERQLP